MSAEELGLFDEPTVLKLGEDPMYEEDADPMSPEVPVARKNGPRQRLRVIPVLESSSDSEPEDIGEHANSTTKRPRIINRPQRSSNANENLLIEMKEMLCKMSKEVDHNELALKEFKDNSM